jgi:hypothetical protein
MNINDNLRHMEVESFQTKGIGSIKIAQSLKMLIAAVDTKAALRLIQVCGVF